MVPGSNRKSPTCMLTQGFTERLAPRHHFGHCVYPSKVRLTASELDWAPHAVYCTAVSPTNLIERRSTWECRVTRPSRMRTTYLSTHLAQPSSNQCFKTLVYEKEMCSAKSKIYIYSMKERLCLCPRCRARRFLPGGFTL